ncbi:MAG: hypothetical protein ACRDGV_00930 [Candidatus Limnocylindria bacterium]
MIRTLHYSFALTLSAPNISHSCVALDRARRSRSEALYGDVATAGAAEFAQLLKDVGWLLNELASRTAAKR